MDLWCITESNDTSLLGLVVINGFEGKDRLVQPEMDRLNKEASSAMPCRFEVSHPTGECWVFRGVANRATKAPAEWLASRGYPGATIRYRSQDGKDWVEL